MEAKRSAHDGSDEAADTAVETEAFRAEPGSLYVVATPIGNLRDLTLRALDILRSVDVIRAEDTRVTATLLSRTAITTRPRALHRHNEAREIAGMLGRSRGRAQRALVSDAGTPAISDPGAPARPRVASTRPSRRPIPGANAMAAAVPAAGLDAERFVFIGFLPAQAKARRELLAAFGSLPVALVLYEAPHRVADAIGELARSLDARRMLTIAREMTKTFETIARMRLADAAAWLEADANRTRGEFVLIVDAPLADASAQAISAEASALLSALLDELPPARAARVAAKLTHLPREMLYEHALSLKPAPTDRA